MAFVVLASKVAAVSLPGLSDTLFELDPLRPTDGTIAAVEARLAS